jgi:hypothetical protein
MLRQILKELLVVSVGTLFFLILCASVGISTSKYDNTPTVIAQGQHSDSDEVGVEDSPDGRDGTLGQGSE